MGGLHTTNTTEGVRPELVRSLMRRGSSDDIPYHGDVTILELSFEFMMRQLLGIVIVSRDTDIGVTKLLRHGDLLV